MLIGDLQKKIWQSKLNSIFQALKLNERFRKLREVETKGFWEGQIGIKQRKYVDISVPFNDTFEIRDNSITNESETTLQSG